jgi:hypothetical protein
MNRPLCFVLMPFGTKPNAAGSLIDFDAVYQDLIAPAIADAELEPLRADEEMTDGIIHKPMFERLILCEYAVADLTTANAMCSRIGVSKAFFMPRPREIAWQAARSARGSEPQDSGCSDWFKRLGRLLIGQGYAGI